MKQQCIKCSNNKYQDQKQSVSCKECAGVVVRNYLGEAVLCKADKNVYGAATCRAGKYWYAFDFACVFCPLGKFSPSVGAASCRQCVVGKYQSEFGSSSCARCPQGYVGVRGSLANVDNTTVGSDRCVPCLGCGDRTCARGQSVLE